MTLVGLPGAGANSKLIITKKNSKNSKTFWKHGFWRENSMKISAKKTNRIILDL